MSYSLVRQSSLSATAGLRRLLSWPARVAAARRTMAQLARMSDIEMHDIGLVRQDTVDVNALSVDAEPPAVVARRRAASKRPAQGRTDFAA